MKAGKHVDLKGKIYESCTKEPQTAKPKLQLGLQLNLLNR